MFTITKIAPNNFTHFDGFKEMNFSNWEINFNNTTNTIILQLRNGAPFPKREVLASEVIIKDGIDGTPETFSTTEQIRTRLLALNYNPLQSSGSGGGAVDSVNGQTGVVVLDADDIEETATRKWQSANQDSFNDATSSIQTQLDGKISDSNQYLFKHLKEYFTDLTGYTNNGFTPTYANGKMIFTGGAGNFNQYLAIDGLKNTDENIEIEVTFKVISLGFGVGIGKRSINTWYNASSIMTLSPTQNSFYLWDSQSVTIINSKATPTIALNDIVKIKYTQLANVIYCTFENLTTGIISQFKSIGNLSTTKNFKIPNSSDLVIHNLGGENHILSIKVNSFTNYKPDILCIGDSKTVGYSAKNNGLRWANNIGNLGTVVVSAGDGDRTVEITQTIDYTKLIKPKNVILCIGRNDLGSSVASVTWQANYQNIVAQLVAEGINVIHLLPIPETSLADQSALKNWIIATYGFGNTIDPSVGWNNATMLSSDAVHPNEVGHAYIAKKIIDSGLITPSLPVKLLSKNREVDEVSAGISANTNNYLPFANAGVFSDSEIYRASAGRYGLGTTTPFNYGGIFGSYEIVGSIYGIVSIGKSSSGKRFYFSAGGPTTEMGFFGVNNAGTFKNIIGLFESGNVSFDSDGGTTDVASAKVFVNSTTQGFLPPRMTTIQKNAIVSPEAGLMVYDTTINKLCCYNGTIWNDLF